MEFDLKNTVENFEELLPQVEAILSEEEPVITNLSNFTALLKQSIKKISWVGFYFFDGEKLILVLPFVFTFHMLNGIIHDSFIDMVFRLPV